MWAQAGAGYHVLDRVPDALREGAIFDYFFSEPLVTDDSDAVRMAREQRPTASNQQELLNFMDQSRSKRRQWILQSKPSIDQILKHYPRFQDMPEAVKI